MSGKPKNPDHALCLAGDFRRKLAQKDKWDIVSFVSDLYKSLAKSHHFCYTGRGTKHIPDVYAPVPTYFAKIAEIVPFRSIIWRDLRLSVKILFKPIPALILSLVFGLLGAGLRYLELRYTWDAYEGFMKSFSAASLLLILLSFAVLALSVFLSRGLAKTPPSETKSQRLTVVMGLVTTLALLLSSGFEIMHGARDGDASLILFGVFSFLTAAAFLIALYGMHGSGRPDVLGFYLLFSVFWATFWLIVTFRDHAASPVILSYIYDLLAIVFCMLTALYVAGCFFGRTRPLLLRLSPLMGLFFSMVALLGPLCVYLVSDSWAVDAPSLGHLLRLLFAILFSATALLLCQDGRLSLSNSEDDSATDAL